jgi:anti-sigma B factor antagonist
MRFEERKVGDVFVARVIEHRLSADVAERFKEDLIGFVNRGYPLIVLDLSQVEFIDSSGLGALIATRKALRQDGELALCGANDNVATMFRLTRMNKIFRMYGSVEEAAAALPY